jgi:hypothetical protein
MKLLGVDKEIVSVRGVRIIKGVEWVKVLGIVSGSLQGR